MNLQGSFRALRNNSRAAMLAAIEIYNKPQITYRDECFSILLINAWELLLKAIISKNKQRIYYPKKKGEPYRTFSLRDTLVKTQDFFPSNVQYEPVAQNISMLEAYRHNAIHFYNQRGFKIIIYGLAQTNIVNYRDLMLSIFNIDIANEMTLGLLPLSFGIQPDPIEYIQKTRTNPPDNKAVAQFLREISQTTQELEARNLDTSRFLTIFKVNFQSVKKISSADIVTGVKSVADEEDLFIVERRVDPNISHPMRQKEIIAKIGSEINGVRFTTHTFQAIIWKYEIKDKPLFSWRLATGGSPQYSTEVVSFIKRLSRGEIETALHEYKDRKKK
jgi:hypothetical protein